MNEIYSNCILCPRKCGVNRNNGEVGVCGVGSELVVSRVALHMWEEPCISGEKGSGTVFFSGCNMHCVFCQNYEISGSNPYGKKIDVDRLAECFLELQDRGANNINLVTPTHFVPSIVSALRIAKDNGLKVPVVYNTSGYECVETLKMMEGLVDIYLPDFKYMSEELALNLSKAPNYSSVVKEAIKEMVRQVGEPVFDGSTGLIKKGVIVRHLVVPGHTKDSMSILKYLYEEYKDNIYISIMNQYTPFEERLIKANAPKELLRKVTKREYEKVVDYALEIGIKKGFTQEGKAASESFIPSFKDCEGV